MDFSEHIGTIFLPQNLMDSHHVADLAMAIRIYYVVYPIVKPQYIPIIMVHFGSRENLNRKPWFLPLNMGEGSCEFSRKPIQ